MSPPRSCIKKRKAKDNSLTAQKKDAREVESIKSRGRPEKREDQRVESGADRIQRGTRENVGKRDKGAEDVPKKQRGKKEGHREEKKGKHARRGGKVPKMARKRSQRTASRRRKRMRKKMERRLAPREGEKGKKKGASNTKRTLTKTENNRARGFKNS